MSQLYLRNKTCYPCLHGLVKTEANVWENSRVDQWKPETQFSPAREISQTLPMFSPCYEGTENMFYFFYKIIVFRLSKEKYDIRSAWVECHFFHEIVNSYNLKKANHIAHVIFVLHSAMKTHFKTNQNARTIQTILWIYIKLRTYHQGLFCNVINLLT